MTPEEQAVIDAAVALYHHQTEVQNGRGRWEGDAPLPGVQLRWATEALERSRTLGEELRWVLRTWADVVAGDTVRPPGFPDVVAHVSARYRSVSEDPAGETWHMVAGGGHWSDHVVRPGEVWVVLDQETDPRCMERTAPVEILLTASEVAAIELLGWENRVEQR